MASFNFELVAPERVLYSGQVSQVVVPGAEGEMTVLAGHSPVMTTLRPGIVTVSEEKGAKRLFVRGGFADVTPDGLTILAEQAIPVEELNADRIAQEMKNAEEDLADAKTDEAKRVAMTKLGQLKDVMAAIRN
jgi:F-type H+-transporting ATPase subunit epsilon